MPHRAEENVEHQIDGHPRPRSMIDGDDHQPQPAKREILNRTQREERQRARAIILMMKLMQERKQHARMRHAMQQVHEQVHQEQQDKEVGNSEQDYIGYEMND